jgi:hypothetical protein
MLKLVAQMAGAAAFAAVMGTSVASAQDREIENAWIECGIGAMIFDETPVAAAVSNIIWDLGTTAVTSAVSSPDACMGSSANAALFINQTYAALASETASGSGEYLTALGDIYDCSEESRSTLVAAIRENVAESMAVPGFAELQRVEKAEAYFNVVDQVVREEFAAQCNVA